MKHLKFFIAAVLLLSIICNGCATIFSGGHEEIDLQSEPSGAKVLVNGKDRGETPTTVRLKKSKEYSIEFVKEGYKTKTFNMTYSLGVGWLVLDILCGLVGIIVDAVTGNWNGFNIDSYKAVMEKQ